VAVTGNATVLRVEHGLGSVWVTRGTEVLRVDPASLQVVATMALGRQPANDHVVPDVLVSHGAVWVRVLGKVLELRAR
jgi:hypothetical protein